MIKFIENLQYFTLALTIAGQVLIGGSYFAGQGCWLAANLISVLRCFVLQRPAADTVKECALTALTAGLMIYYGFFA